MPDPVRRRIQKRFKAAVNTPIDTLSAGQLPIKVMDQRKKERLAGARAATAQRMKKLRKAGNKEQLAEVRAVSKRVFKQGSEREAVKRLAKEAVSKAARKTLAATQPTGTRKIKVA